MHKMLFGRITVPSCYFHKSFDEEILPCCKVHHAAMVMPDQRNMPELTHRDSIRHLKFAVPQVSAAGADDVGEIVGHMQVFPVVHTHAYQQPGIVVMLETAVQVVVF